jgi:hypothetical protein
MNSQHSLLVQQFLFLCFEIGFFPWQIFATWKIHTVVLVPTKFAGGVGCSCPGSILPKCCPRANCNKHCVILARKSFSVSMTIYISLFEEAFYMLLTAVRLAMLSGICPPDVRNLWGSCRYCAINNCSGMSKRAFHIFWIHGHPSIWLPVTCSAITLASGSWLTPVHEFPRWKQDHRSSPTAGSQIL